MMVDPAALSASDLLDALQRAAFGYFVELADPRTGLVADTSRAGAPASIAVMGFALSAYCVGAERGWIERAEAAQRTLAALAFLRDSDQSGGELGTGYKGFYYHFLDCASGRRVWRSELSMIDSALLIAGALTAARYFDAEDPTEHSIRAVADALYRRVDWRWAAARPTGTVSHGWKPECGFLHYGWEGYSEAIILYALGLGSPTFALEPDSFAAWASTYQWENLYGCDLLYAGPLFVHQFPHAWIDFRGIRDRYMREKDCDYFDNGRRAVWLQREYARRNPLGFAGYDADCWGLSAGDGPGHGLLRIGAHARPVFGYAARGAPYGPDDGTVSAPAALSSLPFAPVESLAALRTMLARYPHLAPALRLPSGFNPSRQDDHSRCWVSPGHFGLDQGCVLLMLENHRSELVWRLLRGCGYVAHGLRRAGFSGGWL